MKHRKTWLTAECWATKATLLVAQTAFLECGSIGLEWDDGEKADGIERSSHDRILLKAYFDPAAGLKDQVLSCIDRFFSECQLPHPELCFSEVEEQDWQANFFKSCTTFKVEPGIFIVPSFEIETFDKKDQLYIEMDPENAFGTGQHQTTKLVLKNIYEIVQEQKIDHALDVGCGSGILAILMKKLGVDDVLATDVDEDSLITSEKNANKNKVHFTTQQVDEHHQYPPLAFDLVAANILAPVLIDMADNLLQSLKPTGFIILSGILKHQSEMVIKSYEKSGATLFKQDGMDDWCALVFTRSKGPKIAREIILPS
jgi:ribosomal protein L11 methyltransferase